MLGFGFGKGFCLVVFVGKNWDRLDSSFVSIFCKNDVTALNSLVRYKGSWMLKRTVTGGSRKPSDGRGHPAKTIKIGMISFMVSNQMRRNFKRFRIYTIFTSFY